MNPLDYSMTCWKEIVSQTYTVRAIKDTIRYAELCNKYLKTLTSGENSLLTNTQHPPSFNYYEFFQFDVEKWEKIAENLIASNNEIGKIKRSKEFLECHLDLIEALAEYNLQSKLFSQNSQEPFLSTLIDKIKSSESVDRRLEKIFAQAKDIFKGDMFICNIAYYENLSEWQIWKVTLDLKRSGLFACVCLINPEKLNSSSRFCRKFQECFASTIFTGRRQLSLQIAPLPFRKL